jgi:hypothetical protein
MNSQEVRRRNQPQVSGQSFGTGRERDPGAEWCAFGMSLGTSFETLEALVLGPSNFVPKLTHYDSEIVQARYQLSPHLI